jgi:cell wall-associated NlpC family hydrolase
VGAGVTLGRVRRAVLVFLAMAALSVAGCGSSKEQSQAQTSTTTAADVTAPAADSGAQTLHAHPQAVEPVAGAAGSRSGSKSGATAPAVVSVGPASGSSSGSSGLAQPVSDATIRQELAASGLSANSTRATLTSDLLAITPVDAPAAVQAVIQAGNEIAHLPYRFGGGHGTFEDNAYDCSGSLSFVLSAAGLLGTTVTSGQLEHWGQPGPGKWITVFAAAGHTFMYVAGLRFDTVALAESGSRWSNRSADEPDLKSFVVRHPAGL